MRRDYKPHDNRTLTEKYGTGNLIGIAVCVVVIPLFLWLVFG